METSNFLLVGVGGQGTLLASNVLARVGVEAGFDVKKAEVHGMAQRGGSVSSHVRWGAKIHSPLIGTGEVDCFVAFEKLEALRWAHMLRPGGVAIVGDQAIPPLSVSSGSDSYPGDSVLTDVLGNLAGALHLVPSMRLAEEAGTPRAHNIVVLGAVSRFTDQVPLETWLDVVAQWVPQRYVDMNLRAFQAGRDSLG